MCLDLEIRVGSTFKKDNEFETYTLFPFDPNDACTPVDGEWIIGVPNPITAQFVSVTRQTNTGSPKVLSINYIEVEGETPFFMG